MGIINAFYFVKWFLASNNTTKQNIQSPPCLKDKWINRLMSKPVCFFFQKSHGMEIYIEHHTLAATVGRKIELLFPR
jgi:hypothetical protein